MAGHARCWLLIFVRILALGTILKPRIHYYNHPESSRFTNSLRHHRILSDSDQTYYLTSRIQLNRVNASSHMNISSPALKTTKHGSVTMALPDKLFWTDLTMHMDVQRNPGPVIAKNCRRPSQDSVLRNSNLPVIIKYSRTDLLNYSRTDFLNQMPNTPVSSELSANSELNNILYSSHTQIDLVTSMSRPIPVLNISQRRSGRQSRTFKHGERLFEHRNFNNLVCVQRIISKPTKTKFGIWNAQSINK